MISNLRISVAELVVWALLATAGLAWVLARIFDGIERAWGWLVRRDSADPPWWWNPWLPRRVEDDDEARWAYPDDGLDDEPPPLPPERTWEQMTSHQLPLAADWDQRCYNPCRHDPWHSSARCGPCHLMWPQLAAAQERRAPEYEAEARAHYVAMGFDFPSGLMARIRETICEGQCEGMGCVPVRHDEDDPRLAALWEAAEAREPTDDGWHFVVCPDCNGTWPGGHQ